MGIPDRSIQTAANTLDTGPGVLSYAAVDQHVQRIRRIGKRLFGVANCVVTFTDATSTFADSDGSSSAIEAAFCSSIPQTAGLVVVSDTRKELSLYQHSLVTGLPFIRFYVSYPIHNSENVPIGNISLIDYAPRAFGEEDRQLLVDLANLVERELHLRSLSATHIDLQKKNKTLRRKSLIDPLIGTWNRRAIMRILSIESVRCDKAGMPLSLILIDLDFFKNVNDTYGHPVGDAVLVKVASRLRSCIRQQEALGRYGGEEFLVVLPGSPHDTAMSVADRMRAAVASEPELVGDIAINLTISAGVASTELFSLATTDELIQHADVALYAAKDAGRNCVMQATPQSP